MNHPVDEHLDQLDEHLDEVNILQGEQFLHVLKCKKILDIQ